MEQGLHDTLLLPARDELFVGNARDCAREADALGPNIGHLLVALVAEQQEHDRCNYQQRRNHNDEANSIGF